MYKEKIVDIQTGEITERDFTKQEIEKVEAAKIEAAKRLEEAQNKQLARKAIFEKLGLTEEEAQLLLS
jgi:hypothetical protein